MSKRIKSVVLLGLLVSTPNCGWAQDREFPTLNSIGRFWGVGYTRGGFHAAQDGRFDVVTNRHPATDYRRGGLPTRNSMNYSPTVDWTPPTAAPPGAFATPTQAPPLNADKSQPSNSPKSPARSNPQSSVPPVTVEAIPAPKPVVPAKPTQPPPAWLQEYLEDEETSSRKNPNPSGDDLPAELLEISPSDLQFDDSELGDEADSPELGQETGLTIRDISSPQVIVIDAASQFPAATAPVRATATPTAARFNRYRR